MHPFVAAVSLVALTSACVADDHPVICGGQGDYAYADEIVEAPGFVKTPGAIDVRENAVNGTVDGDPEGRIGSLDVYSRGLSTDPANHFIVLRWSGRRVVDVDGPDIVVFENAFETAGGTFMDPVIVEVSNDAKRWVAFEHDYLAADETRYSKNPDDWQGFAGRTPVTWQSRDCSSPFGPGAGGDAFDLAELDDEELQRGFTFLRLTAAPTQTNPETGEPYPRDFISDGFDLDGVFAQATENE